MLPNKLGYVSFVVLAYTLYRDWVHVNEEFYGLLYVDAKHCEHLYITNQCSSPMSALVRQCAEWYICKKTQNVSGSLVWAEVIKRFFNRLLDLDLHVQVSVLALLLITLVSSTSKDGFKQFLLVSKGVITSFFAYAWTCVTILGLAWICLSVDPNVLGHLLLHLGNGILAFISWHPIFAFIVCTVYTLFIAIIY